MRDRKELFFTVSSRFIALISTFGIVLISSIFLGAEGRGYISLTLTDAALVAIFSNVISGSSAMYFLNKMGEGKVFFSAFLWILFCSMIGSGILSYLHASPFLLLFLLSTALSFHTLVYNQLFANQQFIKGNFLSILVQVAFLTALLPLFIFELPMTWEMYFAIQISIWFLVTLLFLKHTKIGLVNLSELKTIFNYGIKNELSFFLQFFSYRLSYFFIFHQLGVRSLGVFGVMVIIAESVWVISKSFSTVSFAKQLKDEDISGSVERTNYYTKLSLLLSFLILLVLVIVPENWYSLFFTSEFSGLQEILLVVSPGILAMSGSTIIGHFFAAQNRQWVLIYKSLAGVLATLLLTPIMLDLYGIWGAALVMSISHLVSSMILYGYYFIIIKRISVT
jgi:O-antigen/teichoic acid export membrane protein